MSTNKFTDEFKRDAVAQVVDRGYSVLRGEDVARSPTNIGAECDKRFD